ncbi:hypothetical protein MMC32_005638 [Xylographa parallela]|nr:hypothetical protein [Xylographa parallela]
MSVMPYIPSNQRELELFLRLEPLLQPILADLHVLGLADEEIITFARERFAAEELAMILEILRREQIRRGPSTIFGPEQRRLILKLVWLERMLKGSSTE